MQQQFAEEGTLGGLRRLYRALDLAIPRVLQGAPKGGAHRARQLARHPEGIGHPLVETTVGGAGILPSGAYNRYM